MKHFTKSETLKKIIVGDFNLKSISWPRSEDIGNGNGTYKLFIGMALLMSLGLINVFQDIPTIKVELLT